SCAPRVRPSALRFHKSRRVSRRSESCSSEVHLGRYPSMADSGPFSSRRGPSTKLLTSARDVGRLPRALLVNGRSPTSYLPDLSQGASLTKTPTAVPRGAVPLSLLPQIC